VLQGDRAVLGDIVMSTRGENNEPGTMRKQRSCAPLVSATQTVERSPKKSRRAPRCPSGLRNATASPLAQRRFPTPPMVPDRCGLSDADATGHTAPLKRHHRVRPVGPTASSGGGKVRRSSPRDLSRIRPAPISARIAARCAEKKGRWKRSRSSRPRARTSRSEGVHVRSPTRPRTFPRSPSID